MNRTLKIVLSLGCIALLTGAESDCSRENAADKRERQQTATLAEQASVVVGMPAVQRFTEKRMVKMLYELRDQENLVTYSYYLDLQGKKHRVCPTTSVGFGIPYATQFTNPQRDIYYGTGSTVHMAMPQPEPNGLFMPSTAEGTWVMCLNPQTKQISPVYVEPRVIVSPFSLDGDAP